MPRCKINPDQFIAGQLPTVKIKDKSYFVDGRMEQLRNTEDFMDSIDCVDDDIWELLSKEDQAIVIYEFMGEVLTNQD